MEAAKRVFRFPVAVLVETSAGLVIGRRTSVLWATLKANTYFGRHA